MNCSALFVSRRYKYDVDYDFDYEYDCQGDEDSSCAQEGICRCGRITSWKILSVDPREIIKDILQDNSFSKIKAYCVDRIIRRSGWVDTNRWTLKIEGGYYGEEVDAAYPYKELAEEVAAAITVLDSLNDNEAVEHVLRLEYGHLLPKLENRIWVDTKVYLGDVFISQPRHFDNLNKEQLEYYYKNISLSAGPIAICLQDGDKYRLVDGYHRIAAATKMQLSEVTIITAI
jgi:hypothetical protein